MTKYLRIIVVTFVCIYFWYYAKTYTEWHFIDGVNLIFHESGHTILFFTGDLLRIAAGSLFQIVLPLFIALYFFFNEQKISGSLCLLWTGQNLLNVSVYAGDAVKMELNLLGGDSVIHDWNYLLTTLGMLKNTAFIASTIYALGIGFLVLGTSLSLYYGWYSEKM